MIRKTLLTILFLVAFDPVYAATIFYRTNEGTPNARPVYGVHPDSNIKVPTDVRSITVPETSDAIVWPVPTGQTRGREQWTVVDTTTNPPSLKLNPGLIIAVDPDLELKTAIEAATTLQELKDALTGKTRAVRVKGGPIK